MVARHGGSIHPTVDVYVRHIPHLDGSQGNRVIKPPVVGNGCLAFHYAPVKVLRWPGITLILTVSPTKGYQVRVEFVMLAVLNGSGTFYGTVAVVISFLGNDEELIRPVF